MTDWREDGRPAAECGAMLNPVGTSRPCPTCGGKGVVVVKGDKGDEERTCPTCHGSKRSGGIATK